MSGHLITIIEAFNFEYLLQIDSTANTTVLELKWMIIQFEYSSIRVIQGYFKPNSSSLHFLEFRLQWRCWRQVFSRVKFRLRVGIGALSWGRHLHVSFLNCAKPPTQMQVWLLRLAIKTYIFSIAWVWKGRNCDGWKRKRKKLHKTAPCCSQSLCVVKKLYWKALLWPWESKDCCTRGCIIERTFAKLLCKCVSSF